MASTIQTAKLGFATYIPAATQDRIERYEAVYDNNRHRIYSLAFYMTGNELAADELLASTFARVFSNGAEVSVDQIDGAFLCELREIMPIGILTLNCASATDVHNVRRNTLRTYLERAVIQLPATEKLAFLLHDVESYDHNRIARIIGTTEEESMNAVHQARLRLREILATMKD
jgi:RNA polymerase sigma-70 factor, ECF subfamily